MKNSIIFVMFVLTVGCNSSTNNKSESDKHSPNTEEREIQYIGNENFSNNALDNYSIKYVTDKYNNVLKVSKEPQMNNQDSSVIDTIYSFRNSDNKIEFYKAVHAEFIVEFDVTDPRFELKNEIKPGISKEQFIKKLKINVPVNDTVSIGSVEETQYFTFYFNNGILERMELTTYID